MSIIYYYNACMHADTVHIIKLLNGKGDMLILVSMDKNKSLRSYFGHDNYSCEYNKYHFNNISFNSLGLYNSW